MAGIHGDEVTGSNSMYQIIKLFSDFGERYPLLKNILNSVRLIILPIVNISGFA